MRANNAFSRVAIVATLALAGAVRADDLPRVPADHVSSPPVVDGRLDDLAWLAAPRFAEFGCLDFTHAPAESTVVWLACDESMIYCAFRCYDRYPAGIVREQTVRGGLAKDDRFELRVDPTNQRRANAYFVFGANARGTQAEVIPDGSAGKVEWRGDWIAATRIDSLGWTGEFAIPLENFHRPPGEHAIGVAFARWHHRTDT